MKMKKPIVIIAAVLVPSASFAGQATFESIQHEFQQKVLSLLPEEDTSSAELYARIAKFPDETLGAHPDLVRKETERRLKAIPQFPAANLAPYVEHKSWGQFPLPRLGVGGLWLAYGCDPARLAHSVKMTMLARTFSPKECGRLALLNACCPDKLYRLGKGDVPDLIVDSLGDLFVIEVEMAKVGACKPVSVKWMKKKARETEPPPAE